MIKTESKTFDLCTQYIPFLFFAIMFAACVVIEVVQPEFTTITRNEFYSKFGMVVRLFSIALTLVYSRKYQLNLISAALCAFVGLVLVFGQVSVWWRDIDLRVFGAASIASFRSSMFLLPACLLLARFLKKDTLQLCDYLAPYFFYFHGAVTLACWVEGCCAGKPGSPGIYNQFTNQTAFPLQPCIVLLSVGAAFWGLWYAKRHDYKAGGKVYAQCMIIYGVGRYVLEFFSDDMRILGALSVYSFCSLAMVIMGGMICYFIYKKERKKTDLEDKTCL